MRRARIQMATGFGEFGDGLRGGVDDFVMAGRTRRALKFQQGAGKSAADVFARRFRVSVGEVATDSWPRKRGTARCVAPQ